MENHYVPQCYLRQFLNNSKKLVTLNLKILKERGKYVERSFFEKAICYEDDFYRITGSETSESFFRELNNYPPNYIEEKAFLDFENNFFNEYHSLVNEPAKPVNKLFWTKSLISLKKRNPFYFKMQDFESVAQTSLVNLEKQFREITNALKAFEAIKSLKYKLQNETKADRKYFLSSLIHDSVVGNFTNVEKIISLLNWDLLQAHPSYPFVTSDNPGFSITSDGRLENLKFLDNVNNVEFYLPLSPTHCLRLTSFPGKINRNPFVGRLNISKFDVLRINLNGILLASKYCISNIDGFFTGMQSEVKSLYSFRKKIEEFGFSILRGIARNENKYSL